jgi:transcriptional regulator with XRE-family HTH domain
LQLSNRDITPDELTRVRFELGGFTQDQAAQICAVDRSTYRRWERGAARIPAAAFRLLHFHANGFPIGDRAWSGWRFHRGRLYSPENVGFDPGEIRALPYLYALVAELTRETPGDLDGYANVLPFRRRE